MNIKGESDILKDVIIYLILLVIFVVGMIVYLNQQQEGAVVWEEYYVKEIVKVIDFSKAGDEYFLDVHRATEIAKKNYVGSFSDIFSVDNVNNEICVKLSRGRRTCFNYFNDVDVVNMELRLAGGKNEKNEDVNILYLKIKERRNVENEK